MAVMKGLHLDGVDDTLYIADAALLDAANGISMSMWIRRDYNDDGDTDELGSVIASRENHFVFYISGNELILNVTGVGVWRTGVVISRQMHCHLVIVSIDSGTTHVQKVYLDGELKATKTWAASSYPAATNTNLYVGSKFGSSNFFKGTVHHFFLVSAEWSAAEVTTLYGSGTPADDIAGDVWITRLLVDELTGTALVNEELAAAYDGVVAGTERWTSYAHKDMAGLAGITFDVAEMPELGTFSVDRIQFRGTDAAHTCQVADLSGHVIFNGLGTNDVQDLSGIYPVYGLNVKQISSGYVRVYLR